MTRLPPTLVLLLGLASLAPVASSAPPDSILVARERIELPSFETIEDRALIDLYAPRPDYRAARGDTRFVFERLSYLSDGLQVVALFYHPAEKGPPLPTIVFNRGSYIRNDTAPEYLVSFHRFATKGFAVLAPMYRGSEGAAGRDEMGGDELADLMQVGRLAQELPAVDPERLFLLGESRGGMMVLQAIREAFPAKAAATYGAPTDFFALFDSDPGQYEPIADQLWPEWRGNRQSVLGRRSAIAWADRLDVPLLIMHGGSDRSMPVSQSLSLASRLNELDKPYELQVFGYENHMISGRAAERDALAAEWFERHAE